MTFYSQLLTILNQLLMFNILEKPKALLLEKLKALSLPKIGRVGLLGAVALLVFLFLPALLRLTIDPRANGFTPDTIGATALGAFQFFAALTIAFAAWRVLFPPLYAYAAETMQGKLLESITSDLVAALPPMGHWYNTQDLAALTERRKIATLTFIVRCTRFAFSVLPFVFFFLQANAALTAALTAVPSAAPGL
jgi:hypothetical protein